MLDPVRALGWACVGEAGLVLHVEVNDWNLRCSSRIEHRPRRLGGCGDAADVDAGAIEHAAGRGEVVLSVDHDHRDASRIEVDGLGSGVEPHNGPIIGDSAMSSTVRERRTR